LCPQSQSLPLRSMSDMEIYHQRIGITIGFDFVLRYD
jgi:hypothetical protein